VPGSATSSRARALGGHAAGAAVVAVATARLYATGGYAVVPGDVLACPLHAATGLWCPFCGGLRCVAALAHGDLAAAASFNLAVLALLPVVAGWWGVAAWSAARGRPNPLPRVTDRAWLVVLVVLAVFTVWRNLPGLPLAGYLAP
jgi:hypothetical protein